MSLMRPCAILVLSVCVLASCGPSGQSTESQKSESGASAASQAAPKAPAPLKDRIKEGIDRGIRVLRDHQDPKTGAVSFASPYQAEQRHPGVTALALLAYLQSPRNYRSDDGPFVRNALEWLTSLQKADGSIYERDSRNYVTSVALTALVASEEPAYQPAIERARDWIVDLQAREDTGYKPTDRFYGGVGYGGDERPDLSNHQFALEAVHAAGLPADHPFWQRSVAFLQRNQNWSETNDQVWKDEEGREVRPGNDGGAIYTPGESKAGVEVLADGTRVFRSYGSMSYALLKSYIFCALDRRDPRVRAVHRWCTENFSVDRHPGFQVGETGNEPYQGLFYYYHSMARCMAVVGERSFEQEDGTRHDWPVELAEKLLELQNPETGAWVNQHSPRWEEGAPVLATAFSVLALEECLRALAK